MSRLSRIISAVNLSGGENDGAGGREQAAGAVDDGR